MNNTTRMGENLKKIIYFIDVVLQKNLRIIKKKFVFGGNDL